MSGTVYIRRLLKFTTFVMIILIVIILPVRSLAADNTTDREKLLDCGYSQEFINSLTDKMCEKIVLSIGDNEVESVKSETDETAVRGNVLIKKITASLKDKQTGRYTGESVCVYWEWKDSKPLIRDDDKITVNWDKDSFVYSENSFYAEDYYKSNQTEMWSASESYSVLSGAKQGSVTHCTGLKKFSKYIGGSMVFNLDIADSEIESNNGEAYVSYEHIVPFSIIIFPIVILGMVIVLIIVIRRKKSIR
ncbi:MAG: hypothetical protein IKY78_09330 [Clostridia bacterium]|nr:hypothetical protein [Clostridia bacterium]